ncbi:molybdenum cofactor biosynthesis protein MoaE [Psychromicrobium lacuslunae]|uniref:Molybdenum cofactor biosynthesis protein MoaE n=1 Tax=Psychromicrobium lacuslunae TaxID=1618207 RepID=A0A0D4BW98_9MICC|nr:molybdenum cofactor biosynthesis protein MoaE [Psychromicrobium lacuslunae]AJT40569.1 molybdenum cofactor biosynthesis protein MoaE [Psychromicrobium lacuslunae]
MSIEAIARLASEPISLETALREVEAADCGAVVGFSGVVRDHDAGKGVLSLSYSAHPSAEQVLQSVLSELLTEYAPSDVGEAAEQLVDGGSLRIWAAHRIGDLQIGDPALVCAVAAAHRGLAFEVCSALVDRIKARVPIWKEQFFSDGSVEWVGL